MWSHFTAQLSFACPETSHQEESGRNCQHNEDEQDHDSWISTTDSQSPPVYQSPVRGYRESDGTPDPIDNSRDRLIKDFVSCRSGFDRGRTCRSGSDLSKTQNGRRLQNSLTIQVVLASRFDPQFLAVSRASVVTAPTCQGPIGISF